MSTRRSSPGTLNGSGRWNDRSLPESPPTPTPDPVERKLRELREYADDDDADTDVTGDHNIVAMPGSHVHVHSDPEIDSSEIPLKKIPGWGKVTGTVLGALLFVISAVKAWYEARKH